MLRAAFGSGCAAILKPVACQLVRMRAKRYRGSKFTHGRAYRHGIADRIAGLARRHQDEDRRRKNRGCGLQRTIGALRDPP
jgi:hypothetical protein